MKTNIQNQTALITGANHGIGLALTHRLLEEGWQVIALVRSGFPEDDVRLSAYRKNGLLRIYTANLSDFDSLRRALKQIQTAEEKIDVLFNNAGGSSVELTFTKQGREMHFDLQTVAPYVIFMELKPLLEKGTLRTVVNTSSSVIKMIKQFDPDKLEHPTAFKKLYGPYASTKLALSLWTRELAPQAAAAGFRLLSVDPGGNNTLRKGKKSGIPFYLKPIMKLFFPHPSRGASLLYEAAVGSPREAAPGVFLVNGRVTALKFTGQGAKVLEKVDAIYRREFKPEA